MKTPLSKLLVAAALLAPAALLTAQEHPDRDMHKAITPSAGPRVNNGADFFLTADFLFWTARQENTSFALNGDIKGTFKIDEKTGGPTGDIKEIRHSFQDIKYKFKPGFRIGVGAHLPHDGWDLSATYTWFEDKQSGHVKDVDYTKFQWLLSNIFSLNVVPAGEAKGEWDIRFNNVDVELGRNYFLSPYLTMRPHMGLRASWQEQEYTTSTLKSDQVTEFLTKEADGIPGGVVLPFLAFDEYKIHSKQTGWNVGTRIGLNSAWHFTKEWSLFGDFALSTLWSSFKTTRSDSVKLGEAAMKAIKESKKEDLVPQKVSLKDTVEALKPVIETSAGLCWDNWFDDDNYHIGVKLGWEDQVWFGNNNLLTYKVGQESGNLTFQGLTLKARLDF